MGIVHVVLGIIFWGFIFFQLPLGGQRVKVIM